MPNTFENVDNSSGLANSLFTTLTNGLVIPTAPDFSGSNFSITPDKDSELYKDVSTVSIADVTEDCLEGDGAFDKFMSALDKHLDREFKNNRITGSQYAEVYTAVANQALGQAVSFTLQKDQAKWQAITAQMQARIAEIEATKALIELEKAKFETVQAQFDMNLSAAQFSLTKMQIATEEANHDSVTADVAIKQYQRNHQMPAELAVTEYERTAVMPTTVAMNKFQVDRILPAQAAITEYQNRVLQPLEKDLQEIQRDRILPVSADIDEYRRDNMLPVELAQQQHILNERQPAETQLVKEQMETQRANTLDNRSDNLTPISGVVALQKRNLTADADTKDYVLASQMPQQTRNITLDGDTKSYVLANQLPKQVLLVDRQIDLTAEQRESERAKTLDVRSDGATVEGSVGKQKDLYDQQIDSFIKDAAHKTAKMYLDAWITQKTLDEGLNAPSQLTNNEINEVLSAVRANNNLGS